jgi:hypothetical protein
MKIASYVAILLVAVFAVSAQASTVTFSVETSTNAGPGTFEVFAEVSLGDNAGLQFYSIQMAGTNDDLVDVAPRNTFNPGVGAAQAFTLDLLIAADSEKFNRGQSLVAPAGLVYGLGQTAGSFPAGVFGEVGSPWDAKLKIGSGSYPDFAQLSVVRASANTFDATGQTGASTAETTANIVPGGVIPEPTTMALAGFGLIGLITRRRRG